MRTTKRFTPAVLERFRREGRGIGIYQDYIPWHRVSRSDPASQGRSHLVMWHGRQRELLSDEEWVALLFSTMLPNVADIREQFPLALESNHHELEAYYPGAFIQYFPGTQAMATQLGYKHPMTYGNGQRAPWVMTTDLLLTLKNPRGRLDLLAVACKPASELTHKRTKQLLEIEKAYWQARGVPWLLITPDLYDKLVGLTLRNVLPWSLGEPVPQGSLDSANSIFRSCYGHSLTHILLELEPILGDMNHAQLAFWQGVWFGQIPIDLRRGWRPHIPPLLLSTDEFTAQNPVAMRRSAWN